MDTTIFPTGTKLSEDKPFFLEFKQLKEYYNFRRKFDKDKSDENKFDKPVQNEYYLIDRNWLNKWKKYVGFEGFKNLGLERDANDKDYDTFMMILQKAKKDVKLFPLDNSDIYREDGRINPLAQFVIINKKCRDIFGESRQNMVYHIEEKSVPLLFLKDKIILHISGNIKIILFKNDLNNVNEEIVLIFLDDENKKNTDTSNKTKASILQEIAKEDFKGWLKNRYFEMDGPDELEMDEKGCKIKIINKNLKLKQSRFVQNTTKIKTITSKNTLIGFKYGITKQLKEQVMTKIQNDLKKTSKRQLIQQKIENQNQDNKNVLRGRNPRQVNYQDPNEFNPNGNNNFLQNQNFSNQNPQSFQQNPLFNNGNNQINNNMNNNSFQNNYRANNFCNNMPQGNNFGQMNLNSSPNQLMMNNQNMNQMQMNQMQMNNMPMNQMQVNQMSMNNMPMNQMQVNQMSMNNMPMNQMQMNQMQMNNMPMNQMQMNQMQMNNMPMNNMPMNQMQMNPMSMNNMPMNQMQMMFMNNNMNNQNNNLNFNNHSMPNQNINNQFPNKNLIPAMNQNQNEHSAMNQNPNIAGISFPHQAGLMNVGQSCYMNATIECLSNIKSLSNNLLKVYGSFDIDTQPLCTSYSSLLFDLFHTTQKYIEPRTFKEIIGKLNPLFEGNHAADAKDLIFFLIETMHKELLVNSKKYNNNNNEIDFLQQEQNSTNEQIMYKDFINELSLNTTFVSEIFYGINRSVMKCLGCGVCKYSFQTFNLLIFPLKKVKNYKIRKMGRVNNLDLNLIDAFLCEQEEEKLEGENMIYCNRCRKLSPGSHKQDIYGMPKILIIILNRGRNNQDFNEDFRFDEILDFTNQNIIVNPKSFKKYYLCGIITHLGESGSGGHFIAYCRNNLNDNFLCYNDASVQQVSCIDAMSSKISKNELEKKTPYILLYHFMN